MPIERAMAVPRPVLLALAGLGVVACLFFLTHRSASESVKSTTAPAQRPAVAPQPAAPKKAGAHKAVPARHAARRHAAKHAAPGPGPAKPSAASKRAAGGGVGARVLRAA